MRISAATAMASAERRSLYGSTDTYLVIWRSLADVLGGLEDIDTDFAEYKYHDSLVEQVRHWLCGGRYQCTGWDHNVIAVVDVNVQGGTITCWQ